MRTLRTSYQVLLGAVALCGGGCIDQNLSTDAADSSDGATTMDAGGEGSDATPAASDATPGTDATATASDGGTSGSDAAATDAGAAAGSDAAAPGSDAAAPGTDAAPPPPPASHDTCATPLVFTTSTVLGDDSRGAGADMEADCGYSPANDLFYEVSLAAPASVDLLIAGGTGPDDAHGVALALRDGCSPSDPPVLCTNTPWPGTDVSQHYGNLPAGDYLFAVWTETPGLFSLTVLIGAPEPLPANDTCAGAALVDPTAGPVTVTADTTNGRDDATSGCGDPSFAFDWLDSADVFYTLFVAVESDVTIDAATTTGARAFVGLRATCTDDASELACLSSDPFSGYAQTIAARLDAGLYTLVASTPAPDLVGGDSVSFTVTATPVPTGGPPDNDTCAGATPLVIGTPYTGAMDFAADDYGDCAGVGGFPERVHTFTLPEARELLVQVTSASDPWFSNLGWELWSTCGDPTSALSCFAGAPAALAAGTYTIAMDVVPSAPSQDYTLYVDAWRGAPMYAVTAADVCDGSEPLEIIGGDAERSSPYGWSDDVQPSCSPIGGLGPDSFFQLSLAAPATVDARTIAEDGVVGLLTTCGGAVVACGRPRVEAALPAGDYLLFVDKPTFGGGGSFNLAVNVTP
jgi:hypothetical protein